MSELIGRLEMQGEAALHFLRSIVLMYRSLELEGSDSVEPRKRGGGGNPFAGLLVSVDDREGDLCGVALKGIIGVVKICWKGMMGDSRENDSDGVRR